MSFTSKTILQSFISDSSFLTEDTSPTGFDEAVLQVDDLIFQKTGIAAPAAPTSAPAILRWIANCLLQWTTLGMRKNVSENEQKRCRQMYEDASAMLDKIQSGEEIVDSTGAVISDPPMPATYFDSTQRFTDVL